VEISLFNIDEHSVGISIKDSGVGISKEYLPDLFEPFVQQEMGYSRPFEGMGLGLPIVKKLVDANNGEIKVESEPGKGSTFTLGFRKG